MSDSPTPETDGLEVHKDDAVWRSVVPSKFARRLERERNAAREELSRVRKELVAANRGAETNAKVNQGLCAKLAKAERKRDEASRERDDALKEWDLAREGWSKALEERDEARKNLAEVLQRLSVWESAATRMKKQLSFAPPFHQGTPSQEEA